MGSVGTWLDVDLAPAGGTVLEARYGIGFLGFLQHTTNYKRYT